MRIGKVAAGAKTNPEPATSCGNRSSRACRRPRQQSAPTRRTCCVPTCPRWAQLAGAALCRIALGRTARTAHPPNQQDRPAQCTRPWRRKCWCTPPRSTRASERLVMCRAKCLALRRLNPRIRRSCRSAAVRIRSADSSGCSGLCARKTCAWKSAASTAQRRAVVGRTHGSRTQSTRTGAVGEGVPGASSSRALPGENTSTTRCELCGRPRLVKMGMAAADACQVLAQRPVKGGGRAATRRPLHDDVDT